MKINKGVVQMMYRRAVMYFYINENKEEYEKSTYPYRIDLEDFYKKTFKVKVGKYGEPYDDINIRIVQILQIQHEKNNLYCPFLLFNLHNIRRTGKI